MNTSDTTTTASAQPTRIMPEHFKIASKALIYARNVTTSQHIYSRLGEILNEIETLSRYISA